MFFIRRFWRNNTETFKACWLNRWECALDEAQMDIKNLQLFCAPKYYVSQLPQDPLRGSIAFAIDGRKRGEGPGGGSGVLVFYDDSSWVTTHNNRTVEI